MRIWRYLSRDYVYGYVLMNKWRRVYGLIKVT